MVKEPIHPENRPLDGPEPLVSEFRDDEGMRPIIRMFLEELPDRVQSLSALRHAGDRAAFRRMVHQIKGAGGGYGFPAVTTAATQLERCLDASGNAWLEQCEIPFQALLNLLHRAHAGLADLPE